MHLSHQFHQSALKREPECLKIRGKRIAVWHRLLDWGNVMVFARFLGFLFVFLKCDETRKHEMILVITGKTKRKPTLIPYQLPHRAWSQQQYLESNRT